MKTLKEASDGSTENKRKMFTSKVLKSRNCQVFALIQSLFLLVNGLFWLFIFPLVFDEILESKMTIKEGTVGYEAWKKPNIPTKIKIYLFSVENPVEVENGEKPSLKEVGPFTYSEQIERINEKFEGDKVSYETKKVWNYIEDESLPLDTLVTTVDVPIIAVAETVRGSLWQVIIASLSFHHQPTFLLRNMDFLLLS